jgi:hypothetical protein
MCSRAELNPERFGAEVWCSYHGDGVRKQRQCNRCVDSYNRLHEAAKARLVKDVCAGEHYMQHAVVDTALKYIRTHCTDCTHLLLTSDRNIYSSDFFAEMLSEDSDLVICDFWETKVQRYVQAQMLRPGAGLERKDDINLGATLFNMELFESYTFLGSAR